MHNATKQPRVKALQVSTLLSGSALALMLLLLGLTPLGIYIEQKTSLNWLFLIRGPITKPKDIVIINLNSSSAERMGLPLHSFSWPRTVYANILDKLTSAGARLVVLDIAFRSPRDEEQDSALEAALARAHNTILYTYMKRHQFGAGEGSIDIEQAVPPLQRFAENALGIAPFTLEKTTGNISKVELFVQLVSGTHATQPVLSYLALTSIEQQRALWRSLSTQEFPSDLSLNQRALMLYNVVKTSEFATPIRAPNFRQFEAEQAAFGASTSRLKSIFTTSSPLFINYFGAPQTLEHIDVDQMLALNGRELKNWFNNKIVYIGYSEAYQTEQLDAYRTVFSKANGLDVSGVEISATVFANLYYDMAIQPASKWVYFSVCLFFIALVTLSYKRNWLEKLLLQTITAVLFGYFGVALFSHQHYWLPLAAPLLVLFACNLLQLQFTFLANRLRLQQIAYTLNQFLPSDAAFSISRSINALEKQHQLVYGVVLMTDIKGYTALSEKLAPDELHRLMNRYYQILISAVERHGGMVGNIVGDSLLALWTGPSLTSEMCSKAMLAATMIRNQIRSHQDFSTQLPTCMALHGGQFSLGNLGAEGHFEYSPVGDIINTVSRIEHFNRDLNTEFLCSGTIAKQLTDLLIDNNLIFLGDFELRHKSMAIDLFTTISPSMTDSSSLVLKLSRAIDLFEKHAFEEALAIFSKFPSGSFEGPCRYYIAACKAKMRDSTQLGKREIGTVSDYQPSE